MKSAESSKSKSKASGIVRDGAGLVGLGALSYGAWLAWPPAGFMLGGFLLLAGAALSALGAASEGRDA